MKRPIEVIRADIAKRQNELHEANVALQAAKSSGDRLAECRCKARVGYARRTLHCLAHEAERSLMLVGDPLTV
jgi:hypothetical protein